MYHKAMAFRDASISFVARIAAYTLYSLGEILEYLAN
jgi:hypothetical protein